MAKTQPTEVTPKSFLENVEHPVRRADALVLLDWFEDVTGYPPVMWGPSIIGYGRYHYEYASGRSGDFLMTGFSPRKAALSIYILPGYQDRDELLTVLGKHKVGKSCLYVNKLADIDLSVLEQLVREGVAYLKANYDTYER